MAQVDVVDERTIKIKVTVEDAVAMIEEASRNVKKYAREIITIRDKMPEFAYTHFCFYAYDTATLFEQMLQTDPKEFTSFSLDAPDGFFYTLYGGMNGLYDAAREALA